MAQATDPVEFFEKQIRPVLAENCYACHNPETKTAQLDLTIAQGFQTGGQSGPVMSPENLERSRILEVIRYEGHVKMPPTGKLEKRQIAALTKWVKRGAHWPGTKQRVPRPRFPTRVFTEEERGFWAFHPVREPPLPRVKEKSWVVSPIDRFILEKLEASGLEPAPPAHKLNLLRRAIFDLTGLPPTEREIEDFLTDDSQSAFEKVVERLLASPRYGERWARHWFDVVRYADSSGNDEDHRYPYAWRYRDYVIEAFNSDLPYNQFIREQLAGDLLPAHVQGEINRQGIIATGFLALGQKAVAQQDKTKMLYDVYDEQLDVTSKALMGLSITCARCHDHKFDPITTRDYYSLISIFASTKNFTDPQSDVTRMYFPPLVPQEEYERFVKHTEALYNKAIQLDELLDKEVDQYDEVRTQQLSQYMLAARAVYSDGLPLSKVAHKYDLEKGILKRWVDYLTPGKERRPHLDDWYNNPETQLIPTAQGYQSQYEERLKKWNKTLRNWRKGIRTRLKERLPMPPAPKPEFDKEEDPFFYQCYFNGGPFAISEEDREGTFPKESRERIDRLRGDFRHLEETTPREPELACAVAEGEAVQQKVFIRGDYSNPGEDAPKAFPAILAGENQPPIGEGSGRLQLADWLTQPDHPLTGRVMVNRIWQWHFGEGLVRTPNNFGKTGEKPTHSALLDYLARRFVDGWSLKKMHRLMMLSNTYQMSGQTTAGKAEADLKNHLLSHFHLRRLEVEEIRDALLAIDGSLDLTMGGTLLDFLTYTDTENSNSRLSLNPERNIRRSIYLPLRRANLPTLLNLFDFGDATTSLGKRPSTNIAPQALFMMNSEFLTERSRNLASSLLTQKNWSQAQRLQEAYLRVLNRYSAADEIETGLEYIEGFQKRFGNSVQELDAWQSFCRILMASNEFIYLQ